MLVVNVSPDAVCQFCKLLNVDSVDCESRIRVRPVDVLADSSSVLAAIAGKRTLSDVKRKGALNIIVCTSSTVILW